MRQKFEFTHFCVTSLRNSFIKSSNKKDANLNNLKVFAYKKPLKMSQSAGNNQNRSGSSNQSSAIERLLKNHIKTVNENFAKLSRELAKVSSDVQRLLEIYNLPDEAISTQEMILEDPAENEVNNEDPGMFDVSYEYEEVETPAAETLDAYIAPSDTSIISSASSSIELNEVNHVMCFECKKVFVKGSLNDSISKHVRETDCRPYKCLRPGCGRLFKRVRK